MCSLFPTSMRTQRHMPLAGMLVFMGCSNDKASDSAVPADVTPVQTCDEPTSGFARFSVSPTARGLQTALLPSPDLAECGFIPGAIVAADLDGDGDDDVLINQKDAEPILAWNEDGQLVETTLGIGLPSERTVENIAAVDIDGDALPDIFAIGQGHVALSRNNGGGDFSAWEFIYYDAEYPLDCHSAIAFGDLDSDGDLDFVLPGLDRASKPGEIMGNYTSGWKGSEDLLFRNDDGDFVVDRVLSRTGHEDSDSLSLQVLFTDRDGDRDVDLFVYGDRSAVDFPPAAFFRNDGLDADGRAVLVDDAPDISAAVYTSAMGYGIHDLNQDGLLDYCSSDVSLSLSCLLSGTDGYVESGRALGFVPDLASHPNLPADISKQDIQEGRVLWSTWSLAMMDLDNDGWVDMAAVAGPPPDNGSVKRSDLHAWQPDWIWQGAPDGTFTSQMLETGFSDPQRNYGMVPIDLDADGYRELIITGYEGVPVVWENPCGAGNWLDVRVGGAANNQDAIGAIVTVYRSERTEMQEVRGPVSMAQAPLALHFGLGDEATVSKIHVWWPDGAEATLEDVRVNQRLVVAHP